MMQMGPARRSAAAERLMQFKPDPTLKPTITRLPQALATLAAPDVKSAVAWRTFELNPMLGMGKSRSPIHSRSSSSKASLPARSISLLACWHVAHYPVFLLCRRQALWVSSATV
jgi:hypothetical protein